MNNDITSRSSLKNYARTVLSEDSPTNIALLKMFDEIIDNAPDCWTPVSEKLPDKNDNYLCTVDYGEDGIEVMQRVYWDALGGFEKRYNKNDKVIAWMPLPEAYKEV